MHPVTVHSAICSRSKRSSATPWRLRLTPHAFRGECTYTITPTSHAAERVKVILSQVLSGGHLPHGASNLPFRLVPWMCMSGIATYCELDKQYRDTWREQV